MYKNRSFDSFSFGCRVNEAEKTEIDKEMIMAGFIKSSRTPDIYIINTCAVTSKAEREARQLILRLKRKNPRLILVVTGCSATYWLKNDLWKNIPIDLIISNLNKKYIVRLMLKRFYPRKSAVIPAHTHPPRLNGKFIDSGRLLVKIQDGCHRFCSYCIVPYLRGQPVSRSTKEVLAIIKSHRPSLQEAILTAINTEAYGKDNGESLVRLVQTILTQTDLPRISFGSIHPWSLTLEFVDLFRKNSSADRLMQFFHIPLQSASDKILRLMKRDYTSNELLEKLHLIKAVHPYALLATDIIAGFLDETDRDFEETYDFLKKSPISKFHVFRYSVRQNTAAYFLRGSLKEPTPAQKAKRSQALLTLGKIKYRQFLESLVGSTDKALFIGQPDKGFQTGLLSNQIPVIIPVKQSLSGTMGHVTIRSLKNGILTGNIS